MENIIIFNTEEYKNDTIESLFWTIIKIKEKLLAFTKFSKYFSHFQSNKNSFNFPQKCMLLFRKQCRYNY